MNDETSDLDEVFSFLSEERRNRRDPEEHPSPEALTAYQANELSPEEDERIQEHLAACRHCTEMLLELEEFLQPPEALDRPATPSEREDWRESPGHLSKPAGTLPRRLPFGVSLAGLALLILLGGISWWAFHLRQEVTTLQSQIAELRQPVVAPPTIRLRSTRSEGAIEVPADRVIELAFDAPVSNEYSEYRAQIMNEEGNALWVDTLSKGKDGRLAFLLIKGYLKPGEYVLRLVGVRQGSLDLLQENRIRVPSSFSGSQEK